jgi:pimeloyl-ACP methyl ester carboxylesterase
MKWMFIYALVAALAQAQSGVAGHWQGTLAVGPTTLRIALHVRSDGDGTLTATLDSPDQNVKGIPIKQIVLDAETVRFESSIAHASFVGTLKGNVMEGQFTQGSTLPLTLTRIDQVHLPARPQEPRPPYPYRVEEVQLSSNGVGLAGTFTIPEGRGPHAAVVLVAGSGAQDRDAAFAAHKPFLVLADALTRRGIAVLRMDDRGVGGSEGNAKDLTEDAAAADVLAAITYLKSRPEVNAIRLGVAGHREGGFIAAVATTRSVDIRFLIELSAPGLPGDEVLFSQSEAVAKTAGMSAEWIAQQHAIQTLVFKAIRNEADPTRAVRLLNADFQNYKDNASAQQRAALELARIEDTLERRFAAVSTPELRAAILSNPAEALKRVRVPVLVLHGARDAQMPAATNLPAIVAALASGGNHDITAVVLPGLNHWFQTCQTCLYWEAGQLEETISPEALRVIGDWIARR